MGWTGYFATHYKNGKIDKKAELDEMFSRNQKILKSQMVGSTYFAAAGDNAYESFKASQSALFEVIQKVENEMF